MAVSLSFLIQIPPVLLHAAAGLVLAVPAALGCVGVERVVESVADAPGRKRRKAPEERDDRPRGARECRERAHEVAVAVALVGA